MTIEGGSGALREALQKLERYHCSCDVMHSHTCEIHGEVAAIRRLLSLSSPIEPSCVRMEQPLRRLREIASGAVSASVAKQIRECVDQVINLRLYGEPQASSEIRETLCGKLIISKHCLLRAGHENGCKWSSELERALAPSRQGAAKRIEG